MIRMDAMLFKNALKKLTQKTFHSFCKNLSGEQKKWVWNHTLAMCCKKSLNVVVGMLKL